jgi:membrane protein YdbS with pleckstrin-like domain
MNLGDEPEVQPAGIRRVYGNDATVWVWVCYGLAQAIITMLMAFDVIQTLTAAEVVTAVTLVVYVAVNELIVRPRRRREVPTDAR